MDDSSSCDGAALGYAAGIGAILTERCSPCHVPGGVEAALLLDTYAHVSPERMTITRQLLTCAMPPEGSPQLSPDERKQVLDWLACGVPK